MHEDLKVSEEHDNKLPVEVPPRKYKLIWFMVVYMMYIHLAGMYGLYLAFTSALWKTIAYIYIMYILSILGITGGVHRLWTHRAYKAKLPLQIFLMLCHSTTNTQTAIKWVRDHTLHHKYTDTDADPHNAKRGLFYSHIGYLLVRKHPECRARARSLDSSELNANPVLRFQRKYTPQKIDIEFKLQPFVPEYVPGVGDADAFLKVSTPAHDPRAGVLAERVHEHIDNLGLTVLDEPSAEQSDSALLHLQLRAISKTNSAKSTVLAKKIENAEKNGKAIERWIKDVSELHLSKPAPTVTYTSKMSDIDTLMEEWPESVEVKLNSVGFPPAALDCPLAEYAALLCALFDIPRHGDAPSDRIQSLHLLFSLYSAVRGSQLYAERLRETEGTGD